MQPSKLVEAVVTARTIDLSENHIVLIVPLSASSLIETAWTVIVSTAFAGPTIHELSQMTTTTSALTYTPREVPQY
jgi:hypothetical protein